MGARSYWISLHLLMWFFSFIDRVHYVNWRVYIKPSLQPQNVSYLVMVYALFDKLMDSICQYFSDNHCVCIHQGYQLITFCFMFLLLVSGWCLLYINISECCFSFLISHKSLKKKGSRSSWRVRKNSEVTPSRPEFLLWGLLLRFQFPQ